MVVNTVEQKLDADNQQTVLVNTKQHLYPMTARVRDLEDDTRLDTVFFELGKGEFTLNRIELGIYILDVMIKSNQTQNVGIYEAILYLGEPLRDDYKVTQLVAGPTERELLRFAQINMTKVLD